MKILVCIRQGTDGEIGPFDACAYEEALKIKNAEVTLLSMGPPGVKNLLLRLTRLGAKNAVLLSDSAFAGADTLATAYTLALAVKKISPDLVFCGRQTLIGDTAQVGVMTAQKAGVHLIPNVMQISAVTESGIVCQTRDEGEQRKPFPCLLTVERINHLRLPSILSKEGGVEIWTAEQLGADKSKCGLSGSPTRVIDTFQKETGKRKCRMITAAELPAVIEESKRKEPVSVTDSVGCRLPRVFISGESPRAFAKTVSDDITVLPPGTAQEMEVIIRKEKPTAVLFGSDTNSKRLAAQIAARMDLGLCADCTRLETDGKRLIMYRPAMSGSVIAKIESLTFPAMATVRTGKESADIIVAAGYGVKNCLEDVKAFSKTLSAELATSRKAVDYDLLPYDSQVGLTGKTVSPRLYIAIGISGAVHHIVGMEKAGTVIAVNPDRDAPIFEYADYGVVSDFETVWNAWL